MAFFVDDHRGKKGFNRFLSENQFLVDDLHFFVKRPFPRKRFARKNISLKFFWSKNNFLGYDAPQHFLIEFTWWENHNHENF